MLTHSDFLEFVNAFKSRINFQVNIEFTYNIGLSEYYAVLNVVDNNIFCVALIHRAIYDNQYYKKFPELVQVICQAINKRGKISKENSFLVVNPPTLDNVIHPNKTL